MKHLTERLCLAGPVCFMLLAGRGEHGLGAFGSNVACSLQPHGRFSAPWPDHQINITWWFETHEGTAMSSSDQGQSASVNRKVAGSNPRGTRFDTPAV